MKNRGIILSFEAADAITVDTLKEQRTYLISELNAWKNGGWLHPEDVTNNLRLINIMKEIVEYFGGQVEDDLILDPEK